jgi:NtrC-family two-component system response regulator AlgB
VIAATSRDLKKHITKGEFREDLYVRLSTVAVEMPPLRQQSSHLLRFAEHYLKHFSAKWRRPIQGFSDKAVAQIRNYSWPGNIREMCNAIESAVILAEDDTINTVGVPMDVRTAKNANGSMTRAGDLISLEKLKEIHIRKVLERTSSINQAARILGIHPTSIYRQCKKLKLQWQ